MRAVLAAVAAGLLVGACDNTVNKPNEFAKRPDLVTREEDELPSLSAAEVRIFLSDSTLSHQGESRRWHVYLREDGSMTGISTALKTRDRYEQRHGRWFVLEDGQICREWDSDWGGGEIGCANVTREGSVYTFVSTDDTDGEPSRSSGRAAAATPSSSRAHLHRTESLNGIPNQARA